MIEPKNNITSKLGKFKNEIGKQQREIKRANSSGNFRVKNMFQK